MNLEEQIILAVSVTFLTGMLFGSVFMFCVHLAMLNQ